MPGILFVHGGDDFARAIFSREGRGYWAQALPLVLEKYGYVGVDLAGPESLTDPRVFERYDAVLVARLPAGTWTESLAERAVDGRAGVLSEGPLPAPLAVALGVRPGRRPSDHDGQLVVVDPRLREAASAFGVAAGGRIVASRGAAATRAPASEWRALGSVPLDGEQAAAWKKRSWDVAHLRAEDGTEVLAEWRTRGSRQDCFPAIVRRGGLVGCAFGFFGFLGQIHTSEPYEDGEIRRTDTMPGAEAVLLGLVDELHRYAHATRARILPWPRGKRWVRNVRHDVDRPLKSHQARDVLGRHSRLGTRATWYWLARHATPESVQTVARDDAHEIALHTEHVWDAGGHEELQTVAAAAQVPIRGSSAHGGTASFRYQGAPNLLWADRHNLLYTELLQHRDFHPHRFPALERDGRIKPLGPLCLPHHESLDRSTRPGDVADDRIRIAADKWRDAGGFLQVMNHPDINIRGLFQLLEDISCDGCLEWTAGEAADWWQRTHVSGEMMLRSLGHGRFSLSSLRGARDLAVELRPPQGGPLVRQLDLEPSRPVLVSGPA